MYIGLFFGSFNPIHTGHLIIADYVASYLADRVWFVVSPKNPLKHAADLLNVEDRIKMVNAAIHQNTNFELSEAELHLPLPSYTINTLDFFNNHYRDNKFFLIMGSDNFLNFKKWKSSEKILSNYQILVYQRPGFEIEKKIINSNITILKTPYINISSTEIRRHIKEKRSIRYIVPEAVIKLIYNNNLYC